MGACVIILMRAFIKIYFIKDGEWRCLEFAGYEGESWFGVEGPGAEIVMGV